MTVRSLCFFSGGIGTPNVGTTLYTVPTGHTLIWKSVVASNISADAGKLVVWVASAITGATPHVFEKDMIGGENALQEGYVVLNPGDRVVALITAASFSLWLSGSLLVGVAPGVPVQVEQLPTVS